MIDPSMVRNMTDIRIHATNPVTSELAAFAGAILEEYRNLTADADVHITNINRLVMKTAIDRMEAMKPEIWHRWCDVDQSSVVARYRDMMIQTK